jgi:23S rRNA (adenine-N6)-dimethyltransferase
VSERARSARRSGRARSRHFLRKRFAAELVRDAAVRADELVVDLGAGSGRLTSELAWAARRVLAVELDAALAKRLRDRWPNVEVVHADARTCPLPREEFRVVANLPFRGTNDILRHLLDDPRLPLARADLVVQWGVAVKRALPWPSTVNGVVWGASWTIRAARRLARHAFEPPPSVDAGVLVFERRREPLVPVELVAAYRRFVAHGFRNWHRARELDAHEWAARYLEAAEVSPSASASRGARHATASPRPRRR